MYDMARHGTRCAANGNSDTEDEGMTKRELAKVFKFVTMVVTLYDVVRLLGCCSSVYEPAWI